MKAGILGASGYTGAELLRLLAAHPGLEVALATAQTHAGQPVGAHTPSLAAAYPGLVYEESDPGRLDGLDVVFCALPHGESQRVVPELMGRVGLVVDLSADFRLRDPSLYPLWYGEEHGAPQLLAEAVYGLPELFRDDLAGATLVAAAGCYPTAAGLALGPAGAAGPGRADRDRRRRGIGRLGRRPRPQGVAALRDGGRGLHRLRAADPSPHARDGADPRVQVLFTPHLAPMVRGILATCYAPADPAAARTVDGRGHGRAARGVRRRAVRRRARRPAFHQGHGGLQRGARHGVRGPADRMGRRPCAPWTTW